MPRGIYKRTENHIKINSEAHKNQIPWNKGTVGLIKPNKGSFKEGKPSSFLGRKHSKESKKKISLSRAGFKHSEESKRKIGIALKGKIVSEKTKRKMSNFWIGRKRPYLSR